MLSKEDLSDQYCFPAYSSETANNGIIGYTDSPEFICDEKQPVFVTFGDHTRSFNIATKSFSVLDNVKVLLPSINNIHCLLWIITAWQKQIPNLGYARHWKLAKNCLVELPTKEGEIDFDFIESFIAELEVQRVAELEAYLKMGIGVHIKLAIYLNELKQKSCLTKQRNYPSSLREIIYFLV